MAINNDGGKLSGSQGLSDDKFAWLSGHLLLQPCVQGGFPGVPMHCFLHFDF